MAGKSVLPVLGHVAGAEARKPEGDYWLAMVRSGRAVNGQRNLTA